MPEIDELEHLKSAAPPAPPVTDATRSRARASLLQAMHAETTAPTRVPGGRVWRLLPAGAVVTLVVAVGIGVIGPTDPTSSPDDGPSLLGPRAAAAVIETVEGDGYTDVHFLDPTADPARVRSELEELGIDLHVVFIPADPFTVGRLVFSDVAVGSGGIEFLGRTGDELDGDAIGIRVADGWSGRGSIAIGREAGEGEVFETSIPLNAERPGGPLHCAGVRGMPVNEAAEVVRDLGLDIEWRTIVDDNASGDTPPADLEVHEAIWHAADTVMLFAEAGPARPLPQLATEGCQDDDR